MSLCMITAPCLVSYNSSVMSRKCILLTKAKGTVKPAAIHRTLGKKCLQTNCYEIMVPFIILKFHL